MSSTLIDIYKNTLEKHADRIAYRMRPKFRRMEWTYGDLHRHAVAVSAELETLGVEKGDRVLLWAPNSPYWVAVFWGVLLRGAVVVPLHGENTAEFITKVARETEAKTLFKSSYFTFENAPLPVRIVENIQRAAEAHSEAFICPDADGSNLAEIIYTSGTTGEPKGVVLTHKNIATNVLAITSIVPVGPQDRLLSILPLSHMFEQTVGMLAPFSRGAGVAYVSRASSRKIREALKEYRATKMLAVPQFLETVMSGIELEAKREKKEHLLLFMRRLANILPFSLRRVLFWNVTRALGGKLAIVSSGGAPLDPLLEKKWELFGVTVLQGFGLSETAPIVSANTPAKHRFGSVGTVLPGVEARIAPDGEILVKGPNVFRGYYKNEEKTKDVFDKDGWFHTGDIGRVDRDGFLFITGRKKYVIVTQAGKKVHPEDVERELNKQKGVRDSVVLDIARGSRVEVHAVLILEKGADAEAIIKNANISLAPYQHVQNHTIWSGFDFPRSATRKPQREKIRDKISRGGGREAASAQAGEASELTELLASLFKKQAADIKPEHTLTKDLGMDSLLRIELVERIDDVFSISLAESALDESVSVGRLEELIRGREKDRQKKPPPQTTWQYHPLASFIRAITFHIVRVFFHAFERMEVEGIEHVKNIKAPYIVMSNHRSFSDAAAVIAAFPARQRHSITIATALDIMREHARYAPLMKLFMGSFPFARRKKDDIADSLYFLGALLDRGKIVFVFPEGETNTEAPLLPLKKGAGLIAVEMGVPVVPVYITGVEGIVPKEKAFPRKFGGRVAVTFGKPLTFSKDESYEAATKKIHDALLALQK